MKKSLSLLGLCAALVLALPSCNSVRHGGSYEEAIPMSEFSELSVADGELPPWVLEGDDSYQVSAGDYTPEVDRNQFATPEPGESMAVSDGRYSARQNQPKIAAGDTLIEDDTPPAPGDFNTTPTPRNVVDPMAAATPATPAPTPAAATPQPAPRPAAAKPLAQNKKQQTKKNAKKKIKKVDKPTLVVYKVRPGDNLHDIAKRSNTTIAQIRKDSGIKGDVIHPGQIIKVRYTPKGYKPGKKAATPVPTTYIVKRGDTLSAIAKKNGISTAALLKANNMTMAQAAKVRPGRKLTIPAKAASKNNTASNSKKKQKNRRRR
ncbi:MAG: LysM peptidoglycan-binding domain-containing protein [Akkermansia sp.]|nr:LysM peptidoglycan-binding domain-containing protein [Akkermansia sp.]